MMSRAPTTAEVNLQHLRHNAQQLRAAVGSATLMAVVKADAYGHGAVAVARTLEATGVAWFAVATLPEALRLREAGIKGRILVFAAPLPEDLPAYARAQLDVTVSSARVAEAVVRAAQQGTAFRVHVKVDTGMGRIGLCPEEVPRALRALQQAPRVTVAGLWTHLATAGTPGDPFIQEQLDRFKQVQAHADWGDAFIHVASSSALIHAPASLQLPGRMLVRPGIALYGCPKDEAVAQRLGLRPLMTLRSRITQLKTVPAGTSVSYGRRWTAPQRTRIATVAAGYADGYQRVLSNRAMVGIRGRHYPVVGTVCMDMFMVDLGGGDTAETGIEVGDSVVLFGEGGPSAVQVAQWAETITYEVFCRVSARVPRLYVGK